MTTPEVEELHSVLNHACEQSRKNQWWNVLTCLNHATHIAQGAFDGVLKQTTDHLPDRIFPFDVRLDRANRSHYAWMFGDPSVEVKIHESVWIEMHSRDRKIAAAAIWEVCQALQLQWQIRENDD